MRRCQREKPCKREGKVRHACANCDFEVYACGFHQDLLMKAMKDHVLAEHPNEYASAVAAQNTKGMRQKPLELVMTVEE